MNLYFINNEGYYDEEDLELLVWADSPLAAAALWIEHYGLERDAKTLGAFNNKDAVVSFDGYIRAFEMPNGLELDRVDSNGHYEPGNCRWTTRAQNVMNRRCTRYLTVNGVTKTWVEWAAEAGITRNTLKMRLERGWPAAQAVNLEERS